QNRGKIVATIGNARATIDLRGELGPGTTLADLAWAHRPERTPLPATAAGVPTTSAESTALPAGLQRRGFHCVAAAPSAALRDAPTTRPESAALAAALKRGGFRFVGPTTMFALMEALGVVDTHLLGSHRRGSSGVWAADGTPVAEGHTPS